MIIDLLKAFDEVDYSKLLTKLSFLKMKKPI